MLIWNRYAISLLLLTGSMLVLIYHYRHHLSLELLYKLEVPAEHGSSSVVRDIRGKEPYVTIKMKCFYKDNKDYGETWEKIMENTECHVKLFNSCFQNRTVEGRHETHVLTFGREMDIRRCVCTDIAGWCQSTCSNIPKIKCCLDKGRTPVLCRR